MAAGTFDYMKPLEEAYDRIITKRRKGEWEAKGRAEGRVKGWAKGVLVVLRARGVVVSEEARERIQSCTDLEQLERWLERACTVETVEELFAPEAERSGGPEPPSAPAR